MRLYLHGVFTVLAALIITMQAMRFDADTKRDRRPASARINTVTPHQHSSGSETLSIMVRP
jgi:hypothetical protein